MHPREALDQIVEIRRQLVASGRFRGFRSSAIALSGALALGAAAVQSIIVPNPAEQLQHYLVFWTVVAAASTAIVGAAMITRIRKIGTQVERDMAMHAVETVAPSIVIGAWLSVVLLHVAPEQAWLMPGLWSILFSLSVFSTRRFLSPTVGWVGAYFAAAGLACVMWGNGSDALAPWTMALTFGVGQVLAAMVLFFTVEQSDEPI